MARIRSIHPSLFTDEAWASCSPLARVLYIALLTDADDQGLFEWKPLQIKMRLLPGDNTDVPTLLAELVSVNLIAELQAGGKRLGAIRKFCRFQRPKKPTKHFTLPDEWRTYVGIAAGGSEPERDEADGGSELARDDADKVRNQFPTAPELAEQMEDGGGEGREEADASSSGQPDEGEPPKGKPARRKPETPIPEGYPDAAAIAEAQAKIRAEGCDLDAGRQAERFRNHALQTDRRCRDWRGAWRNWVLKALEDAPKRPGGAAPAKSSAWSGPAEVAEIVEHALPGKGAGYLGAHCAWQDLPVKALLCRNNIICDFIRREAGAALEAIGVKVLLTEKAA